jgi:hypothetical protein
MLAAVIQSVRNFVDHHAITSVIYHHCTATMHAFASPGLLKLLMDLVYQKKIVRERYLMTENKTLVIIEKNTFLI